MTEPEEPKIEQENPVAIPEDEPDIPKRDDTPSILDQAKSAGFEAGFYNFGKLEGDGVDFFNPGLVEREDGMWLLVRASGLHPHGFMYGQNRLIAFMLDETGKIPKMGKILNWPVENPQQHFEDPRGFYHPTLHQTIIGACTFMWNGPGDWTGALQVFGAFDDEWMCKKMDYPKIGANPGLMEKIKPPYEKNWIWWLKDDRLHLLYKANPWTVYQFEGTWSQRVDYKIKGVTWNYGEIRGGTTPVLVGDMYFTFHHSSLPWKGRYRRYYAGALAFDAFPPFKPRMITGEPLLIGSQNDPWAQRKPLVVFPCGALLRDGKWLVSCGVNDIKSGWFELTHEQLLARMRPVDDVSGQIFVGDLSSGVESKDATKLHLGHASNADRIGESVQPPSARSAGTPSEGGVSPAQTTLEKRRAALVKARAARAAKKLAANGVVVELQTGVLDAPIVTRDQLLPDATFFEKEDGKFVVTPVKKRRKRRRRSRTSKEKLQALKEHEEKRSRTIEERRESALKGIQRSEETRLALLERLGVPDESKK